MGTDPVGFGQEKPVVVAWLQHSLKYTRGRWLPVIPSPWDSLTRDLPVPLLQCPADRSRPEPGFRTALRAGGQERAREDHTAEDDRQPEPAHPLAHQHPARGAGGGRG